MKREIEFKFAGGDLVTYKLLDEEVKEPNLRKHIPVFQVAIQQAAFHDNCLEIHYFLKGYERRVPQWTFGEFAARVGTVLTTGEFLESESNLVALPEDVRQKIFGDR